MSYFNYRFCRKVDPTTQEVTYGIHEVYYNDMGEITGITVDPVVPIGETPKELEDDLLMMFNARKDQVLDYDAVDMAPLDENNVLTKEELRAFGLIEEDE